MKRILAILAVVSLFAAGDSWAGWCRCGSARALAKEAVVSTEGLAAVLNAKTPVVLLDARTGKFDDGKRIPGAVALSPTATAEEVAKVAPDKNALIVAYCANVRCNASHKLAAHLKGLGYSNVLLYPAGIKGWTDAGHQVVGEK